MPWFPKSTAVFVINYNDATASDVMELCRQVREKSQSLKRGRAGNGSKKAGRIQMKLVIVTGMSGAGKTIALKNVGGYRFLLCGQPANLSGG